MKKETIGIFGAGKLGITLGQLAKKAGYDVIFAGSSNPTKIKMIVEVLVPGAKVGTWDDVARHSDWVILALPLSKFKNIPSTIFSNRDIKLIDAMNYWWEVDGPKESLLPSGLPSSVEVKNYFDNDGKLKFYKSFSHMGYHDLHDESSLNKITNTGDRKSIAYATDIADEVDLGELERFIEKMGFNPLFAGNLKNSYKLEPGSAAFGANMNKGQLSKVLANKAQH